MAPPPGGESRYRVEPNIKDGKGGCRSAHAALVAKYLYGDGVNPATVEARVFTAEEYTPSALRDFLWSVRCNLHFLAGRAEGGSPSTCSRPWRNGWATSSAAACARLERFMKHYFWLPRMSATDDHPVLGAGDRAVKPSPGSRAPQSALLADRRRSAPAAIFASDNGRLNVATRRV